MDTTRLLTGPGRRTPQDQSPAADALPQAMTALFHSMDALVRTSARSVIPSHAPAPAQAPRASIKAQDPDPYNGYDPSKLRVFLSQCKQEPTCATSIRASSGDLCSLGRLSRYVLDLVVHNFWCVSPTLSCDVSATLRTSPHSSDLETHT